MVDPEKQLIHYLTANGVASWKWTDDGDVIAWKDGTTVAFRQEIITILEALIPQDWPPFEALVYLLAACRGKISDAVIAVRSVEWPVNAGDGQDDAKQLMLSAFQEKLQRMQATVADGLMSVANLPADLRGSLPVKVTLAGMLFSRENSMRSIRSADPFEQATKPRIYLELLAILRSGVLTDAMLNQPKEFVRYNEYATSALHEGFARTSLDALDLRHRTGLDAVPQPAPVPIPPATRVRQVLEELQADAEHSGFARLVRDFMAALQLPRRLSEQDEMPIGGFADITNRGNPDRLLLSELAHDDLTLAVRIAVNEALYLRREPPAREPPSTLAILLDSGVRLWGTPRVLATAVGLAFVAKSPTHEQCAVFRTEGAQLEPVDLQSKQGVITQLGTLEPHAHPGAALTEFRARLGDDEHAEAVLITHYDVWKDPDFQRDLALAKFEMLYIALVERDGTFALLRYPRGGAPLCEAQVDIESLFQPASNASPRPPLIDRTANPDLPRILSRQPFPLLLPVLGSVQKSIRRRKGGGACVMHDRRLLAWDPPLKTPRWSPRGARTIASELPRGRTVWLGELSDGSLCIAKTFNSLRHLTCRVYSLEGALLHSHEWQLTKPILRADVRSDVIFLVCTDRAQVHDLTTGAMLSVAFLAPARSHGRYFLNHQGKWCVLSWNGQQLNLDPLIFLAELSHEKVLQVFHSDDSVMPWAVTSSGKIYNGSGTPVMHFGQLHAVLRVADDGRMLLVHNASNQRMLVDLSNRKQWPIGPHLQDSFWETSLPPNHAVRTRIYAIGFSRQGGICLKVSGKRWGWLDFTQNEGSGNRCIALKIGLVEEPTDAREFVPISMDQRPGYSLKMAEWRDGRRAWLDSRGLLHLRCAGPAQTEVTLALGNEMLAAWIAPDFFCGNPFFSSDSRPCTWDHIWSILQAFAAPLP